MQFKTQHIVIGLAVAALAYWAWNDMKKKEKSTTATTANLRVIQDTPQMAAANN
jgi:hypothetical protein